MNSKYKIDHTGNKVRVSKFSSDLFNELTEDEITAITKWVTEQELGRRIAYDQWKLKNKAAVTVFLLRYG